MQRVNEEQVGLLSIGEFAQRSNLSISALRFYGDCGVLVPARTDATTGYLWGVFIQSVFRRPQLARRIDSLAILLD